MQRGRPGLSPTLRFRALQVIITVLVLFWLRFVPVPVPVLVLQLLLQPVFQTQLLLGKPVQVCPQGQLQGAGRVVRSRPTQSRGWGPGAHPSASLFWVCYSQN